jgi:predicted ABC-class ATPase
VGENGYISFVADGSILPRRSSLSDEPMEGAVPFQSPRSMRASVRLPSGRVVAGAAIPRGVVVVTGGGYHGKTTLMEAVQDGVYNHVESDGREHVVTLSRAVWVKAEDGRLVHCVDISSLISGLPGGTDTRCFSSADASGSTSMAASISEAVELGADALLVDEDTSASNLLYKDSVMEKLVPSDPIKQLSQLAGSMAEGLGMGLMVVSGASSAFLDPAHKVMLMQDYVPRDITEEAKRIAPRIMSRAYAPPRRRLFKGIRGSPRIKARGSKIVAKYSDGTVFELDTKDNPRIVEEAQVRMLARILEAYVDPPRHLYVSEVAGEVDQALSSKGFQAYARPVPPDLSWIHGVDVAWTLNRMYGALFTQGGRA